jgi:hypothetical protein
VGQGLLPSVAAVTWTGAVTAVSWRLLWLCWLPGSCVVVRLIVLANELGVIGCWGACVNDDIRM